MPSSPGRFSGVLSKVKWFWLYQSGLRMSRYCITHVRWFAITQRTYFFATLAIVAMPMLQGFWKLRKCCNVNVARILMLSKMLQRSMLQGFLKFLATFERFEFQMLQKKPMVVGVICLDWVSPERHSRNSFHVSVSVSVLNKFNVLCS